MTAGVAEDRPFTILAWNLGHGGGTRVPEIARYLGEQQPAIAVLSEYRPYGSSGATLRAMLAEHGLPHCVSAPSTGTQNTVLIAGRSPLEVLPSAPVPDMPPALAEKMAARRLEVRAPVSVAGLAQPLILCGVHIPASRDRESERVKRLFWQATLAAARLHAAQPALLLGDFNTGFNAGPAPDRSGGTPFSCEEMLTRLEDAGWRDYWRTQHPAAREYSWSSGKNDFRLDHAWASPGALRQLRITADYDHTVRASRASDHSALLVTLRPAALS